VAAGYVVLKALARRENGAIFLAAGCSAPYQHAVVIEINQWRNLNAMAGEIWRWRRYRGAAGSDRHEMSVACGWRRRGVCVWRQLIAKTAEEK